MKKIIPLLCLLALIACQPKQDRINGYVEGEYLRIAPTTGGILATLPVDRGSEVKAGDTLFSLDLARLTADRQSAAAALAQAEAGLNNLIKGKRPEEISVLEKQKAQAEAELQNAGSQLNRSQPLAKKGYATAAQRDTDAANYERALAKVAELDANLKTARMGAREDEIISAKAAVDAARQKLMQADDLIAEAAPPSPAAGRIEDIYYRVGEFVAAGSPVVSLLPPGNIKVRFFVPEKLLPQFKPGGAVNILCDGCGDAIPAKITFVASQSEYTPPVIYSEESRQKLVFMIEAKPDAASDRLRTGQPVHIELQAP
jgi:HlyD family secretion protein